MELKLRDRDYVADGKGGFLGAEGTELVLQQALYLLSARRGGFSLLPEVGSRLHLLGREKPSAREMLGKIYAQEALDPLGLTVKDVTVTGGDPLLVTIAARTAEDDLNLEVYVR